MYGFRYWPWALKVNTSTPTMPKTCQANGSINSRERNCSRDTNQWATLKNVGYKAVQKTWTKSLVPRKNRKMLLMCHTNSENWIFQAFKTQGQHPWMEMDDREEPPPTMSSSLASKHSRTVSTGLQTLAAGHFCHCSVWFLLVQLVEIN